MQCGVFPVGKVPDESPAVFCRHRMFERGTQADEMQRHGLTVSSLDVRRVLRSVCIDEPLRELGISGGAGRVSPFEHGSVQRPTPRRRKHVCVDRSINHRHGRTATEAVIVTHGNTVPRAPERFTDVCACGPTPPGRARKLGVSETWRCVSPPPTRRPPAGFRERRSRSCAPRSDRYGRRWSVSPSCSWRPCLDRGIADKR